MSRYNNSNIFTEYINFSLGRNSVTVYNQGHVNPDKWTDKYKSKVQQKQNHTGAIQTLSSDLGWLCWIMDLKKNNNWNVRKQICCYNCA